MNTFTLEVWYDEGRKCTFYTVKWDTEDDEDTLSETDSFFEKYTIDDHPHKDQAIELLTLITRSIGDKYGAINDFFDRVENKAQALPPKPKQKLEEIYKLGINFPLRLFCYRVSKEIVILFNGGIKDANSAQESSLSFHFQQAQMFAKKIEEALYDQMIETSADGRYLLNFNGTSEIVI